MVQIPKLLGFTGVEVTFKHLLNSYIAWAGNLCSLVDLSPPRSFSKQAASVLRIFYVAYLYLKKKQSVQYKMWAALAELNYSVLYPRYSTALSLLSTRMRAVPASETFPVTIATFRTLVWHPNWFLSSKQIVRRIFSSLMLLIMISKLFSLASLKRKCNYNAD